MQRTTKQAGSQIIKIDSGSYAVSVYGSGELDAQVVVQSVARLTAAFPRMERNFFDLLVERAAENGFTNERLTDAVNRVIDSFVYKELSIADIISYDKRLKLYTYHQLCDEVHKGAKNDDFEMKKIDGRNFWIRTADKYQQ